MRDGLTIIIDPMLATGGSTASAIDMLKKSGAQRIIVACIVTCPDGLEAVHEAHPDVTVYAASIDPELNEMKYIVPGLGDAGDRLYGTCDGRKQDSAKQCERDRLPRPSMTGRNVKTARPLRR